MEPKFGIDKSVVDCYNKGVGKQGIDFGEEYPYPFHTGLKRKFQLIFFSQFFLNC
jgi:hypothetical protein